MGPVLPVEVHSDAGAVARRAAAWIAAVARRAIADRGRFIVAFSGGNTPQLMLRVLATQTIDWQQVHVLQVDERAAPIGSPDRNLTQLHDALLSRVGIPGCQVYPMPVEAADLAAAADAYGQLLQRLAGSPPAIDLVQLGLGADGHTASLMPGDAAVEAGEAAVAATASRGGWRRMTLTLATINRARRVLWLVTGAEKSAVVARLARGDGSLLASRVRQAPALAMIDRAAAGAPG